MKFWKIGTVGALVLALAGCEGMNSDSRTVTGVAGGAAAGLIAAEALGADSDWKLISALAGAAAGTVVAQNQNGKTCAYSRGDGTYYRAACPSGY